MWKAPSERTSCAAGTPVGPQRPTGATSPNETPLSQPVELFNLDVGKSLAPSIRAQLEEVKIGPFSIRFVDDYDQKRWLLSDKGQFVSNLKEAGGIVEVEEFTLPGRQSPGRIARNRAVNGLAMHREQRFKIVNISQ